MFSSNRHHYLAILLLLAGSYFVIFSTSFMFHALGVLTFGLFYLLSLWSLMRIDHISKQTKRSTLPLKSNRYSFSYKTRLFIFTVNLVLVVEAIRFFPQNLAVAIALFAVILAIREWIALMQWRKICTRQIARA